MRPIALILALLLTGCAAVEGLQKPLIGLFVALMLADYTTTRLVIYRGGREVIPYLAWLIERIGVIPALLIAKAIPIGAVWYLSIYGWNGTALEWQTMAWLCGGYALVIVNNYQALLKQEQQ